MGKIVVFLVALAFLLQPGSSVAKGNKVSVNRSSFTSSQVCGKCHQEIYAAWKGSMHAAAVSNPIFQSAYKEVYADTGGAGKKFCLKCHAPPTPVTEDYDLWPPFG